MGDAVAGQAVAGETWGLLPPPHGGRLVRRYVRPEDKSRARRALRRGEAAVCRVDPRVLADLHCLAAGVYSPLDGFPGPDDYRRVLDDLRLADGTVWPLPITLRVAPEVAEPLRPGARLALADPRGRRAGWVEVTAVFRADPAAEARAVYGTDDPAHPGVRELLGRPAWCVAGPVWCFEPERPPFADVPHDPAVVRSLMAERGWRRVVGFQTRNPVHRAHEYLQKCALEQLDGLLLHPLVGPTRAEDVPAEVRMACYRVVVERYFPAARVLIATLGAPMRYAGPREAVLHALVRKNFGCSHFIVGRDHAGVGSYYGPYDAQRIFERFRPEELGIAPIFFEDAFYCRVCGGMATAKTCPHGELERMTLSGTRVRQLLRAGLRPPREVTRPEVADVLIAACRTAPNGSPGEMAAKVT